MHRINKLSNDITRLEGKKASRIKIEITPTERSEFKGDWKATLYISIQ